jgi:hypothetical protein
LSHRGKGVGRWYEFRASSEEPPIMPMDWMREGEAGRGGSLVARFVDD